jgi:hypothetical protein
MRQMECEQFDRSHSKHFSLTARTCSLPYRYQRSRRLGAGFVFLGSSLSPVMRGESAVFGGGFDQSVALSMAA